MSVITVGNFDGVHKGHQSLIKKACLISEKTGDTLTAITFLKNSKNEKTICDNVTKRRLLHKSGCKNVVSLDFDEFSSMDGENFLCYLKENFDLKTFVCGSDFRFGKNASCDVAFLEKMTEKYGFSLEILDLEKEKISSSEIRKLIKDGDVFKAKELLRHPFAIRSFVKGGKNLGKEIGFPTINCDIPESFIVPKYGVYQTRICTTGFIFPSISNVGVRPTVENNGLPNIETFVPNQNMDFVHEGDGVEISFIRFIREEKKFPSVDDLKAQIAEDCKNLSDFV